MELINKYTVIKNDDKKYLSAAEQDILNVLLDKIADVKAKGGCKPNQYFVLNLDEENIKVTLPITVKLSGNEETISKTWKLNACELIDAVAILPGEVEVNAERVFGMLR